MYEDKIEYLEQVCAETYRVRTNERKQKELIAQWLEDTGFDLTILKD